MLGIGCLELTGRDPGRYRDLACAMSLDALRGTTRAFDARIHSASVRRPAGSAARLERLLEAARSAPRTPVAGACRRLLAALCSPGTRRGARHAGRGAAGLFYRAELGHRHPLVIGEEIFSGGNFHGQPLALALDYMAIALTALAGISERRIDRLVNPALNEDLPPSWRAMRFGVGPDDAQVTAAALVGKTAYSPIRPRRLDHHQRQQRGLRQHGMTAALNSGTW